tara:strand:+ start:35 stop:997 length:963 start_codon:yes stop_codon:yes gene_type:complete
MESIKFILDTFPIVPKNNWKSLRHLIRDSVGGTKILKEIIKYFTKQDVANMLINNIKKIKKSNKKIINKLMYCISYIEDDINLIDNDTYIFKEICINTQLHDHALFKHVLSMPLELEILENGDAFNYMCAFIPDMKRFTLIKLFVDKFPQYNYLKKDKHGRTGLEYIANSLIRQNIEELTTKHEVVYDTDVLADEFIEFCDTLNYCNMEIALEKCPTIDLCKFTDNKLPIYRCIESLDCVNLILRYDSSCIHIKDAKGNTVIDIIVKSKPLRKNVPILEAIMEHATESIDKEKYLEILNLKRRHNNYRVIDNMKKIIESY